MVYRPVYRFGGGSGILNPLSDRYEPADIVVKRDEAVTITFADGHVGTFPMVELRLGCPCATCRSLRDRGEESWPRPGSPQPLRITDARMHGGWGLNLTWNDGHATGIFPFESLRHWSEARTDQSQSGAASAPSPDFGTEQAD